MPELRVYPGLTHGLLVAAARAYYAGETPCDWSDLAVATGRSPSQRAVNRALSHLADSGYIEGVYTPLGWLDVRPTGRGLAHAGRAGRRPQAAPTARLPVAAWRLLPVIDGESRDVAAGSGPERPRWHAARAAATVTAAATAGRRRLVTALSPRMLSFRTQVAQAWHLLTTFP